MSMHSFYKKGRFERKRGRGRKQQEKESTGRARRKRKGEREDGRQAGEEQGGRGGGGLSSPGAGSARLRRLGREPHGPAPSSPSFGPGSRRRLPGGKLCGEGRALSASKEIPNGRTRSGCGRSVQCPPSPAAASRCPGPASVSSPPPSPQPSRAARARALAAPSWAPGRIPAAGSVLLGVSG